MRIILTGGAGFLGGHLTRKLLQEGHEVFSIDDYSGGFENKIQHKL